MATAGPAYSVLLPTYNERENVALIVALLVKTLEAECGALPSYRLLECCHTLLVLLCSGLHSLARPKHTRLLSPGRTCSARTGGARG